MKPLLVNNIMNRVAEIDIRRVIFFLILFEIQ